ncbi:MAG: MBL fold metallo-hydrolase [Candidatus Faecivicinus sp.]
MKITFIGTSAGEGYPGVWCECPNCAKARRLGGRNIRGNSCALLDDDFLIDMNAHFAAMAPRLGISPSKIFGLLITHPHMDHFAPEFLEKRAMSPSLRGLSDAAKQQYISPCFTELPMLHVFGNAYARKKLFAQDGVMERPELTRIEFHLIADGQPQTMGDLTFTPVRAQHTNIAGFAHSYILERGGKTLLYASDTGGYDPDMMDIILSHKYDCIIMEGTFGLGASVDGHMSLKKNREMLRLLEAHRAWKNGVNFHLTHICPHWTPPHDEYAAMLKDEGIEVAYDGKVIEF